MTTNDAREVFARSGLTYNDMFDNWQLLLHEIQVQLTISHGNGKCLLMAPFMDGTARFIGNTRDIDSFGISVSGPYFSNRECISFNSGGFIGFAGWASSDNAEPILCGFCNAVLEIKRLKWLGR